MRDTYSAVEISSPRVFSLVERKVVAPGTGKCVSALRLAVCVTRILQLSRHSFPTLPIPAFPDEAIGRIEEVGPGVTTWKVDQRVGVGFFGGEDGTCEACRRGESAYCPNAIMTGITNDGGYAEMIRDHAK